MHTDTQTMSIKLYDRFGGESNFAVCQNLQLKTDKYIHWKFNEVRVFNVASPIKVSFLIACRSKMFSANDRKWIVEREMKKKIGTNYLRQYKQNMFSLKNLWKHPGNAWSIELSLRLCIARIFICTVSLLHIQVFEHASCSLHFLR